MDKQKKQKSNRRNAGFTMVELLIVVAIIGVLGTVAIVGVVHYMRSMTKLEYDGYAKEIFIAAQNHLALADSQGLVAKATMTGTQAPDGQVNSDSSGQDQGTTDGNDSGDISTLSVDNESQGAGSTYSDKIYYFVVDSNHRDALSNSSSALSLMLPFASVDETIRLGGCYLIKYNAETARVLKVFYWNDKTGARYKHTYVDATDYTGFQIAEENNTLNNYSDDHSVIGFYNGDDLKTRKPLEKPIIKVVNGSKLKVEVNDPNSDDDVVRKLIVKGLTSKKEKALTYKTSTEWPGKTGTTTTGTLATGQSFKDTVILDDITTSGKGFSDIFTDFIPGEDITVQLVVMPKKELAAPAYSAILQTNSLFEGIVKQEEGIDISYVAKINNIRHLENLSGTVSAVNTKNTTDASVEITKAEQTSDISWKTFKNDISNDTNNDTNNDANNDINNDANNDANDDANDDINNDENNDENNDANNDANNDKLDNIKIYGNKVELTTNSFYPVATTYSLEYDGKNHSISDVEITEAASVNGNAGLFDKLDNKDIVKNLKLENFIVTGGRYAGALAGTIDGLALGVNESVVENVVVVRTAKATNTPKITGVNNAGGLAGLVQSSTITKSAAAVIVESGSSGNAGGLIGEISDNGRATNITACYSGGHTVNGSYKDSNGNTVFDVTGKTVGGLVGAANGATIQCSYSTCSVQGTTAAGGFVGTASGAISNCYATGLVKGTDNTVRGAFAGQTGLDGAVNCQYFEIINEEESDAGYTYLTPLAKRIGNDGKPVENSGTSNAISPLDANANTYNTVSGDPSKEWKSAKPYDGTLETYYQKLYNLQTVEQLLKIGNNTTIKVNDGTNSLNTDPIDFVAVHYGDWPAPEVFVFNTKATTP